MPVTSARDSRRPRTSCPSRRRVLVMLVLEPADVLPPLHDPDQIRRAPLPPACPASLIFMLCAYLEQVTNAILRHRHFEVRVFLVPPAFGAKGDPRILGGVHRTPRVLGHVGKDLTFDQTPDMRRQGLPERGQLRPNLFPDRPHPPRKIGNLDDLEIIRGKKTRSHDGPFRRDVCGVMAFYGILAR